MIKSYNHLLECFYKDEKYIKDLHNEQDLLLRLIKNYADLLYLINLGEEHTDTFEKIALETTELYVNLLKMTGIFIEYPLEPENEIIDEFLVAKFNLTNIILLWGMDDDKKFRDFLNYHYKQDLKRLLYILL